jgi:hypothetical protein
MGLVEPGGRLPPAGLGRLVLGLASGVLGILWSTDAGLTGPDHRADPQRESRSRSMARPREIQLTKVTLGHAQDDRDHRATQRVTGGAITDPDGG